MSMYGSCHPHRYSKLTPTMASVGNNSGRLIVFIRFFWRKSSKSKPQVTRVTQSTQTDHDSTLSDPPISLSVKSESGLGSPASDTNIFQMTRATQTDSDSTLSDPPSSVSVTKPEAASPPSDDMFFDEIEQLIRKYESVELTGEATLLLGHMDRFKNSPVDVSGSPPRARAKKSIRSDIGVMTPPPSPEKEHRLSSLESSFTVPGRKISTSVEEYLPKPVAFSYCTVPKFMDAFRYTDYEWRTARVRSSFCRTDAFRNMLTRLQRNILT
jgi:hypothetical protein